jgi:hypothetical protein
METFRNTGAPDLTIKHVAQAVDLYERASEPRRSIYCGLGAAGFALLTLGLRTAGDCPPLRPRALGVYRIEAPHLQVGNGVERLGLSEATHIDIDEPSFLQQQHERLGVVG